MSAEQEWEVRGLFMAVLSNVTEHPPLSIATSVMAALCFLVAFIESRRAR